MGQYVQGEKARADNRCPKMNDLLFFKKVLEIKIRKLVGLENFKMYNKVNLDKTTEMKLFEHQCL